MIDNHQLSKISQDCRTLKYWMIFNLKSNLHHGHMNYLIVAGFNVQNWTIAHAGDIALMMYCTSSLRWSVPQAVCGVARLWGQIQRWDVSQSSVRRDRAHFLSRSLRRVTLQIRTRRHVVTVTLASWYTTRQFYSYETVINFTVEGSLRYNPD